MDYKWIDHIVIAVKDLNQGISNYQNGMGMELERTDVSEKLGIKQAFFNLGNLYKEMWPIDYEGNIQSDQSLEKSLRTNEDENFSFEIIKSFAKQILESKDEITLKEVINSRMDVDKIISFIGPERLS